jgi:GNAT superfamily N-acetyltransferase
VKKQLPGGIELDDDPSRVDVDAVHAYLSNEAYWALGRSREEVGRLVNESQRVVGLYEGGRQIGFSRTVSDGRSIAYLADVYVLPEWQGRGLGAELVQASVGPHDVIGRSLWATSRYARSHPQRKALAGRA